MPFHEKIDWVLLTGIAAAFVAYFGMLAAATIQHRVDHGDFVGWLIVVIIAQVVISVVGTAVLAIREPADAVSPQDERDRAITRRATTTAYPLLLGGVLVAAGSVHLGLGLFGVLNGVLAAVMLAEGLRLLLQIVAYRAGR